MSGALPSLSPTTARDVVALLETALELTREPGAAWGLAMGWAMAARPPLDPRREPPSEGSLAVPVARVSLSQRPPR